MPKRVRTIEALRVMSLWTWRGLGTAVLAHVILLMIAFFFRNQIESVVQQIHKTEIDKVASIEAESEDENPEDISALPEVDSMDDFSVSEIEAESEKLIGEQESPVTDPDRVYAPLPELPEVRPNRVTPHKLVKPRSALGVGGGRDTVKQPESPTGAGMFKNRYGESKRSALKKFGGDAKTERAVNLGLRYLAKNQSGGGYWTVGHDVDYSYRGAHPLRLGLTSLCTLPFLAAGHTHKSGKHRATVARAIKYLRGRQLTDGCISGNGKRDMYNHSVATLVLCEAFALTGDKFVGRDAERAVRFLERSQQSGGGWDYTGYAGTSSTRTRERNDLSITGWAILALKSAKSAGISVSPRVFTGISKLYDRYTLSNGYTEYADRTTNGLPSTRTGIGMVGVGLTARAILDEERFDKRNAKAAALLEADVPDWADFDLPHVNSRDPNFHTMYGWYYGTLGMFMHTSGKGPQWAKWNNALKTTLVDHQILDGRKKGSWSPDEPWVGAFMGRFYSTACAVLCLEVYYRYSVDRDGSMASVGLTRDDEQNPERKTSATPARDMKKPVNRSKMLRESVRDKGKKAVPVLVKHLSDKSISVRQTALYELANLKATSAVSDILAMLSDPDDIEVRSAAIYSLGEIGDRSAAKRLCRYIGGQDTKLESDARDALKKLSDGKDFGINRRAWESWFDRN